MNYPERYLNWQCLQMNRNQLPRPISHSEINQSLYDLPSSGLIVFEVLVVCLVNRSRERELKAVEEQQSELLGNHVARMNKLMFNRPKV